MGIAAAMYVEDNNNYYWQKRDFTIPNDGQWTLNPRTTATLPPDHSLAYWGIGYMNYLGAQQYQGGSKDVFNCPSHRTVDEWHDDGRYYPKTFWKQSTYAINSMVVQPYDSKTRPAPLRVDGFPSPNTTIFVQDGAEQKMDGGPDDTIGLWPGSKMILTQWVGPGGLGQALYNGYDFTWEWYRHNRYSEILWVSGHVSATKFQGLDRGVDYRWYTGEIPVDQPKN
jgi:hypothetical protein